MNLKKVIIAFAIVIFFFIMAVNMHYTLQNKVKIQSAVTIGELPPPPGTPGSNFEQPGQIGSGFSEEISATILQQKIAEITSLTQKMTNVETNQNQIKQKITDIQQDIVRLDSQIQTLQQNTGTGSDTKSSVFGTILDIVLLLAVTGIIGYMIYTKKEEEKERITAIKTYLEPYLRQGYKIEQMLPALRQAGYKKSEIDNAITFAKKSPFPDDRLLLQDIYAL